uniref:Uncharacterized protein n=1 Tax=Oryza sativa subsp. japonica TaxID=39947 RepID=Q8H2U9_ORYSJ|nr:hypothetical protein [Oryza sativa Japonica Group]BAD05411.1 hypothetical protein [Oryza sativa Japonica Group]
MPHFRHSHRSAQVFSHELRQRKTNLPLLSILLGVPYLCLHPRLPPAWHPSPSAIHLSPSVQYSYGCSSSGGGGGRRWRCRGADLRGRYSEGRGAHNLESMFASIGCVAGIEFVRTNGFHYPSEKALAKLFSTVRIAPYLLILPPLQ